MVLADTIESYVVVATADSVLFMYYFILFLAFWF